ncbi:MAG: hypothetical protein L0219_07275 [Phycisphaerales bacterium]|nr:hypothetical protein [Phycisphaerales bacterium]
MPAPPIKVVIPLGIAGSTDTRQIATRVYFGLDLRPQKAIAASSAMEGGAGIAGARKSCESG